MSWKNSLREIKKQEIEVHDKLDERDSYFLLKILDSNNKQLEVSDYSFKVYRTTENQGAVYVEQVDRVEGEVSFYSKIPPNDEDYEEEDFIKKMKFKFDESDKFEIEYIVKLNQTSQLVVELDPKGDLMMKYENGKLTFEQLTITYEAQR